jgi:ribosomal-protein-alanine N-acetyltransferase
MAVADLAEVIALEHELFPDDAWSPEMFASELARTDGDRLYLVASLEEQALAGYCGMMFVPGGGPGGGQADVMTVAVREDCWGHGIGSLLLSAMLDAARDRGCGEVFLEVRADNDRAHGLYLRRGFKDIGVRKGYYQPSGTDAIVMRKELS